MRIGSTDGAEGSGDGTAPAAAAAAREAAGPATSAALLLVHGIGEQRPWQTLDAFARGLAAGLRVPAGGLEHRMRPRPDAGPVTMLRIPLPSPTRGGSTARLDLYELYWADRVRGRIRLGQVVGWLARTGLTPLRAWAAQPQALRAEGLPPARLLLRELSRSLLLLSLTALIVLPFAYAALHAGELIGLGVRLARTVADLPDPWLRLGQAAALVAAVFLLRGWGRLLRQTLRYRRTLGLQGRMEVRATRAWMVGSPLALAAVASIFLLLERAADGTALALVAAAGREAAVPALLAPAGALAALFLLRRPLVRVVGDIALYVTADERREAYRSRAEILDAASGALRALLTDPAHDRVFVAGHSLGSVIAYDACNRLLREVRAGSLPDRAWDRLGGLLTFGSPLDKVYYFFRTDVSDEEVVRAQLLSSLHGFRRAPSGRRYGPFRLARYEIPEPRDFRWLNVYAAADPISGRLDFYRPVDRQVAIRYRVPFFAHLAYWNDPRFYAEALAWLGLRPAAPSPPAEREV